MSTEKKPRYTFSSSGYIIDNLPPDLPILAQVEELPNWAAIGKLICDALNATDGMADPAAEIPRLRSLADAGEKVAELLGEIIDSGGLNADTGNFEVGKNSRLHSDILEALSAFRAAKSQSEPKP